MKIAIHQPEHFPYLGFFQKMKYVDVFVILDDAQFSKGNWHNRNKFLNKKMPLFGAMFPLIGLMFFNLNIVPKNIGIGIFVIFLIGIIGTITIWRNKWLNIKTE